MLEELIPHIRSTKRKQISLLLTAQGLRLSERLVGWLFHLVRGGESKAKLPVLEHP